MGRRPNRLLRWAYGTSATLVEPSGSKAEAGYETEEEVPAGWLNSHLHLAGAWAGFLRGPHLGNWSRAAHAALTAYTEVFGMGADAVSVDGADPVYRFAIVGRESTTPTIRVSRRGIGAGWVVRSVPSGITGTLRGIVFVGRWLTWSATAGQLWRTIADDLSGDSAIGTDDATKWTAVTATGLTIRNAAWCGGLSGRGAGARQAVVFADSSSTVVSLLVSTDSAATWASYTVAWGGSAYTTDGTYDATRDRFVAVSGSGGTAVAPVGAPTGTWTVQGGPSGAISASLWKIRAGGGTWLTWVTHDLSGSALAASNRFLARSTDAGATWTDLRDELPRDPAASSYMVAPTDITYADGAWLMTVADAPYLYASHDNGDTWERVALPVGEESTWALARVLYADGQVLATGVDFCVASGRAMATEDTTLVPDTTPSILSDAYRLRGRTIATTAPTNGQVYAWNSGTSQWVPTTVATGSPTTTRGDLIVRGASADQRLAIGAAGRYARSDGTDPAWSQLLSSDLVGFRQNIPLAGYATTVSTSDAAIGGAYFAPADYAISGRTTVLTLEAIGQVVSGVTGTLTLHNLTDATDDATLSWTETSATRKTASVTLPGAAKIYELRFKKSGGAASDYAVISTATLRTTWS